MKVWVCQWPKGAWSIRRLPTGAQPVVLAPPARRRRWPARRRPGYAEAKLQLRPGERSTIQPVRSAQSRKLESLVQTWRTWSAGFWTAGGPKPDTVPSRPIALRLEALIRGFNNPAPLVKRLARLLHRKRDRVRAFTAAPKPRTQPRHGDFALQHAARHAQAAARAFADTS